MQRTSNLVPTRFRQRPSSTGTCGCSRTRAVECRALRRGASGPPGLRPPSRANPKQQHQHQTSAPDLSACTLGRRPDVFNGDASRLPPSFPNLEAPHAPPPTTTRSGAAAFGAAPSPPNPVTAVAAPGIVPVSSSPAAASYIPQMGSSSPRRSDPAPEAAAVAAAWCGQLRRLHLAALLMHREMDAALRDLDCTDLHLATRADLHTAERLHKVLSAHLSLPLTLQHQSPAHAQAHARLVSGGAAAAGPPPPLPQPVLVSLLARVEAAAVQLAAIGARHEAGVYAPLRRFYFSADEPLLAISLRSEQYRRRLGRAVEECGPDSPQVEALLEEVAAALSSRTVAAFLELDSWNRRGAIAAAAAGGGGGGGGGGGPEAAATSADAAAAGWEDERAPPAPPAVPAAVDEAAAAFGPGSGFTGGGGGGGGGGVGRLAAAAAADYWALHELRQELEVLWRAAEAEGVALGALLRLADSVPAAEGEERGEDGA